MKIVEQSHEILTNLSEDMYKNIELSGRTCYKSEDKITEDSAKKFVEMIIKRGHESVLEHQNITVKFITDRGVTHELVRHRLAAYSQESTRYVNYKGGMEVIQPIGLGSLGMYDWRIAMESSEKAYKELIDKKYAPQVARSVLPNSLKTEIVMTANVREWRHVFKLRCSNAAHPQIKLLMLPLLEELWKKLPAFFADTRSELGIKP